MHVMTYALHCCEIITQNPKLAMEDTEPPLSTKPAALAALTEYSPLQLSSRGHRSHHSVYRDDLTSCAEDDVVSREACEETTHECVCRVRTHKIGMQGQEIRTPVS